MVTMGRWDGIKIEIRTDHNPPHFHVTSAEADLMIDLRSFEILAGSGPRQVAERAIAWARTHQDELMAKWRDLNDRE